MKPAKSYSLLQHIRLMCTDKMSLNTKVFLSLLMKKKVPEPLEIIILLVEYLQLFSQAFLLNIYFNDAPSSHFNTLTSTLSPMMKLFNPGWFIDFNDTDILPTIILAFLITYLALKYLFIMCMVVAIIKDLRIPNLAIILWKWFFKTHGRFFYFQITSFWVKIAIAASQDRYNPFSIGNVSIVTISVVIIIIEYLTSLFLNVRYAYLLPSKSFLACKDVRMQSFNLTEKFILQILEISLSPNLSVSSFISTLSNLVLCIFNLFYHFKFLPSYNIKALMLEGNLLAQLVIINLAFFLQSVIGFGLGRNTSMESCLYVIFVLSPLVIKGTTKYIKRKMIKLAIENITNEEPELLIQKISLVKQIQRSQRPFTEFSQTYEMNNLIHSSYNSRISTVFNIDLDNEENISFDLNSKKSSKRIFLMYLENLSSKFPKNHLIKLYLAYYYGSKFKSYGTAMKLLVSLQQSSSFKVASNAAILIYYIQNKLKHEYENSNSGIDLGAYINNLATIARLKEKIIEQADLQIKICREFHENSPDLSKIFNWAQRVGYRRSVLEKRINEILKSLPEYNLEPRVLSARYHLVLNHSILDYLYYAKDITRKYQKYAKQLNENSLCQENMYIPRNAFMMVTNQNGTTGTIAYCSKSAENLFGINLAGNHAYAIAPLTLQTFFFDFFKNPLDESYQAYLGKIFRTFCYHRSRYLLEVDLYINIHPYLSQGLYYNVIVYPVQSSREYLMVSENGTIEAYTEEIGDKLGLALLDGNISKITTNIRDISPELDRINQACNMVTLQNKKSSSKKINPKEDNLDDLDQAIPEEVGVDQETLQVQDAQNLYNIFNSEGKPLVLNSLKPNGTFLTYHCKMQTQLYGSTLVKLIILERIEVNKVEIEQAMQLIWKVPGTIKKGIKSVLTKEKPGEKKEHDIQFFNKNETSLIVLKNENPKREPLKSLISNVEKDQSEELLVSQQLIGLSAGKETKVNDPPKEPSSKIEETPTQLQKVGEVFQAKWEHEEDNAVGKLEMVQQSLGSQNSKSSAQGRVSKAIKEALTINYYPRYYNIFILAFYALLLGVFGSQLGMKLIFDNDVSGRKQEKNVIRTAETRNDLLIGIQRELQYFQDLSTGRLTSEELGILGDSISNYADATINDLKYLASLNNKLLLATRDLAQGFRDKLFERNVKVYETSYYEAEQKYVFLNNFQATERIVESGFKAIQIGRSNITAAASYLNVIFRNALNDFLLKSEEISDIFLKSLDDREATALNNLELTLLITNGFLFVIIVISSVVVMHQYEAEKRNMVAFIKLSPLRVKEVLEGIIRFRTTIEGDSPFEELSNVDISKFYKLNFKSEMTSKKSRQQTQIQNFNIQGIFRKYILYAANVIFLMLIISGFTALNYTVLTNKIDVFHTELHQIQFSDRLSARLNLAVAATQEMLTKLDTTLIRNQPATALIEFCLEDMKILIKELSYVFSASGMEYSGVIEGIIFQDACQYLTDLPGKACEAVKKGGNQIGLMTATSTLENGVEAVQDLYKKSNKSTAALLKIQIDTLPMTNYPNLILNYGTTVVSNIIEAIYEKDLIEAKNYSNLMWEATCGILVVVALFAWLNTLQKVREADGKFKKVLQTQPGNLILSNFILKSYLLKSSNGTLDIVKNEI